MSKASYVGMTVKGLIVDPSSEAPVVILQDEAEEVFLPIWIGNFEASAIALRMEGVEPPRPMTHDILARIIRDGGMKLLEARVSSLKEGTFYAELSLRTEQGEKLLLDTRPSDAIALALRLQSPIRVAADVLEEAQALRLATTDEERVREWLENANPEEFGEYEM